MEIFNIVELSLTGLRKRLDKNDSLLIQGQHGYCEPARFTFAAGAESGDIDDFFHSLKLAVPWDYKQFLLRHDGARLFEHPFYGGGMELFGLDEIRRHYIDYDYIHMIPDGWYPIGSDNGDMLFIDSNQCHGRASNYLYWTEMLFVDSAIEIEMNFERWLERLIICNGAHFWEWKRETSESYYQYTQGSIDNLNTYEGKNVTLEIPTKLGD
ncbi:SMI1/KNR4 family protein [Paenibacillus solani]|uniref:SMI1/KNR4 family protein n=1 Tax=Paenibacillus solani TaxID=1705565 RepID=UPI0006C89718|nr:SMI1/KNR4 family protein [Paenibacillus solani]